MVFIDLMGLSHEMDLAINDMQLVLGVGIGRGFLAVNASLRLAY
jgi:hypothetical protein